MGGLAAQPGSGSCHGSRAGASSCPQSAESAGGTTAPQLASRSRRPAARPPRGSPGSTPQACGWTPCLPAPLASVSDRMSFVTAGDHLGFLVLVLHVLFKTNASERLVLGRGGSSRCSLKADVRLLNVSSSRNRFQATLPSCFFFFCAFSFRKTLQIDGPYDEAFYQKLLDLSTEDDGTVAFALTKVGGPFWKHCALLRFLTLGGGFPKTCGFPLPIPPWWLKQKNWDLKKSG